MQSGNVRKWLWNTNKYETVQKVQEQSIPYASLERCGSGSSYSLYLGLVGRHWRRKWPGCVRSDIIFLAPFLFLDKHTFILMSLSIREI